MKKLILLSLLYLPIFANSQDCAGKIAAARASNKIGNYRLALAQYAAAAADCGASKSADIQKEILEVYDKIEELKKEAEAARKEADEALEQVIFEKLKTDRALIQVKSEQLKTKTALIASDSLFQKANKLVKAFYFYADRFALAFKDNEFYFIDKEGDEVAKLGRWDKAEHFIYSGYAKVRKMENGILFDYLLDTVGNTFLTSSNLALMSWSQQKKIRRKQGFGETVEGDLMALDWDKNAVRSKRFLLSIVYNGYSLEQLPENFGELKRLRRLDLNDNNLKTLPMSIGNLKKLRKLNLNNNKLISLPKSIGGLRNLKKLSLEKNKLSYLPDGISNLINLTELNLCNNGLKNLPANIGNLKKLTLLVLISNSLNRLPENIGQLINLHSLYLGVNELSFIPNEILQLKNLRELDLSYNLFTKLPDNMKELGGLTFLDLRGNPLPSTEIARIKAALPMCEVIFD